MIPAAFFNSVEFYVIAAVAAAAVLGLCIRPAAKGPADIRLLAGVLCLDTDSAGAGPSLRFRCLPDGTVLMSRNGLCGLTESGAVSIAVTITGFDITIEERITYSPGGEPVNTALFTFDFLGQERYHIRFTSESTGLFASFSLSNRPEMEIVKPLTVNS